MQPIALDLSFENRKGERWAFSGLVRRREAYFAGVPDNLLEGGRLGIKCFVRGSENG